MSSPLEVLTSEERSLLVRRRQPKWVEPMKATLTRNYFSDPAWVFEPKLDGERCLVFKKGDEVGLLSRNQKSQNGSYPELVKAAERLVHDAILDAEIVAERDGIPSFSLLQRRMHVVRPTKGLVAEVPVVLSTFDVLYVDGYDTRRLPLLARKKVLRKIVPRSRALKVVRHRKRDGEEYLREVCSEPGWEGLIAKRADSTYTSSRSRDWLKFKCSNEQELVVGGYTDPQGSRASFGALLVGYYEGGDLRYAGKVGTGFDSQTLELVHQELIKRHRDDSPFVDAPRSRSAHWIEPGLVAQIGFSEWTPDGRLRHPRFMGLRRDKAARSVVREVPS